MSHVTTSETEIKLFQPLKLFKIIASATFSMSENIYELQ